MRKKIKSLLDSPKVRKAILYLAELAAVMLLGLYVGMGTAIAGVILDACVRRLN